MKAIDLFQIAFYIAYSMGIIRELDLNEHSVLLDDVKVLDCQNNDIYED